MYLSKRPNLSPFGLRSLILIILMFRMNIKALLLALEFLCCLNRNLDGFFVFME
jgi:hypothetical protein